ncbi:2,3-bisphosphoglycerate-dependent phosphoglycerate mutase [Paenibacillus castaneae]|uniref:histidine phosphatase family protein n=1 Tax=Paenibacillus castaneae TaxID=474957 RepID=UPI000C9A29AA|nr:histidine phosphatase family protein [Paenibacillus castaneae]NIK74948.1 2,3-bisphosphoglycerate-dependent phosphoglycerate mutase [Paenibacillus castaneae]
MLTHIYMVRHAESEFVFGNERSRGLTPEGVAEARKVAVLLDDIEVHYMASSTYARAVQTIQYLSESKNIDIIEYENLRERAIKGLDYKAPWEELLAAIKRSFEDLDYALAGGESTREAQNRAIPIIDKLLEDYRGKNVVIGTHGNIMTIIMNYYDNRMGYEFWDSTSKPDIYKMAFMNNQLQSIDRVWK